MMIEWRVRRGERSWLSYSSILVPRWTRRRGRKISLASRSGVLLSWSPFFFSVSCGIPTGWWMLLFISAVIGAEMKRKKYYTSGDG